ncbi:hypothetical protein C1H46_015318 [Malus baccata]|uniref:Uncharacterized protein n=1 Tax=Malus baccata TaxID=106549 RepID=A0A540MJU6_MALBA|nr:hypothetical protein C1H46_015318 [Malus baccata]
MLLNETCRHFSDLTDLRMKQCSLFGIVGVTDKCLEALSLTCSNTLTTLDVNGCIGIKKRSRDELLQMFPKLQCFKVHS